MKTNTIAPAEAPKITRVSQIKTIDVDAKEWFDRINGNSYFSAIVTLNYGKPDAEQIKIDFRYGYDDFCLQSTCEKLAKKFPRSAESFKRHALWRWCELRKITLRYNKQENCRKRDVVAYTQD